MEKPENCDNCGACCKIMLIRFRGQLADDYCEARGIKLIGGQFMAFKYPCQYLKEGRCSIHDHKPDLCKRMPIGCLDCILARKLEGIDAGKKKEGEVSNAPAPRL